MKRIPLVSVSLVVAAMGLSFVALASPADAATPCVAVGEYYTFAQQCAPRGVESGWLALLLLQATLVAGGLGLLSLRRHVPRRDWSIGRLLR
jgi:hypothetical protein